LNGTAADMLAQGIADAIFSGEFAPGTRLDEQQLAQRFSVSRTPVREALRQLANTGLIDVKPRRGAFVTQVSPTQLEELFVAMGELEATCARLASLSMSPTERRRLQAFHEKMGDLARKGDAMGFAEANHAFHTMIYAGAHNVVLAEMTAAMRRRLMPYRRAQFLLEMRTQRAAFEQELRISSTVWSSPKSSRATRARRTTRCCTTSPWSKQASRSSAPIAKWRRCRRSSARCFDKLSMSGS
jgi:DNA-binding GntR family transcriptional regulator